ncbi:DctP family TRAP transporter solute-binding subunit [Polymorphospora rubra]|uniref:DctP family TRAP transporter solute-binding subunit n=1 Tax=Polymorphospora rubra TaxID=338584 RepID=UPI0033C4D603
MKRIATALTSILALGAATTLAACTDAGDGTVTLSMAHSYANTHPHHRCGAEKVAESVAASNTGLKIEVYPNSTLGGHAQRFASVVSGDIDIDLQGASEISATYAPIRVLDAAYVFDGADHLFGFFESGPADALREDMLAKTGTRVLDAWYFGMRHFTGNKPLRTPDDFNGVRMRFPDTPQFLQNAEALGASATSVAFEEVYISLQQGVVDGQENPISVISSLNLPEVQSHLNLTGHMTGFVMPVINENAWQGLTDEQREALSTAITEARATDRQCIEEEESSFVATWRGDGQMQIVEPDVAAFRTKAEAYFRTAFSGQDLELYNAVRAAAS